MEHKRNERCGYRKHQGERGQVLILALVAMILMLLAIVLIFDVQNVIRGKVKVQNAVDAAALTGAEWQKKSLNLVGELNLVRATAVLISDPFFGCGMNPEDYTKVPPPEYFYDEEGHLKGDELIAELIRVDKEKRRLTILDSLVSQLQTRIAFVGPMIGFGAAQQAAKNNGLNYNQDAGEMFVQLLGLLYRDDLYGNEAIAPQEIHDYYWRAPYVSMVQAVMDSAIGNNDYGGLTNRIYGIAAGSKVEFLGAPSLGAEPPNSITDFLGSKRFYDAIHGRNWCELEELLDNDFTGNWWGNFKCEFNETFSGQSEILPIHIDFTDTRDAYDKAYSDGAIEAVLDTVKTPISDIFDTKDPYPYDADIQDLGKIKDDDGHIINSKLILITPTGGDRGIYNSSDTDFRYNIIPMLNWAIFDDNWEPYSDDVVNDWRGYLRGAFKEGVDYYSGALSYFEAEQSTRLMTGRMGQKKNVRTVGSVFQNTDGSGNAARLSGAQRNLQTAIDIRSDAQAKPIGSIRIDSGTVIRPFEAGRLVLPVFHEVALIPIALEDAPGFSTLDLDWYYFLLEYVPLLGESSSLDEAWEKASERFPHHLGYFSYYHNALKMIDNEDFRQQGINWLNAPASWAVDEQGVRRPTSYNRDHCDDWGHGGPGGTRYGPSSLH